MIYQSVLLEKMLFITKSSTLKFILSLYAHSKYLKMDTIISIKKKPCSLVHFLCTRELLDLLEGQRITSLQETGST